MLSPSRSHPLLSLALTFAMALGLGIAEEPPLETLLAERRYEEALAALLVRTDEWALEARRNNSPETKLDWARSLLSLGMVEDRLARYDEAIEHLLTALQLMQDIDGTEALRGDCHDALGLAASHAGDFVKAEEHLTQAIALRKEAPEQEREPWLSASQNHLGLSFLEEGRYLEAGELLRTSIASTDPDNDTLMAQRQGYLARYYFTLHNNARARDLLLKALPRAESAWGRDDPNTLTLLSQLGLTALHLGETGEAQAIFEEVTTLARTQANDTTSRLRLAGFLNLFGSLKLNNGQPEDAEALFRESLQTLEAALPPGHLALAPIRNNLACTLQELGKFDQAAGLLQQTRDTYLKHVGPDHQRSVEALTNLALNSLLKSGPDAAKEQINEATAAARQVLKQLLRIGTERQRLNYLRQVDPLSLACSAGKDPTLIADTLLATKGRLLDVILTESAQAPPPALREYRRARQQLDLLLLSPGNPDPDKINALRANVRELEERSIRNSAGEHPAEDSNWKDLQASLPSDSAFVDFVRYTDYLSKPARELRYGALLILPTGEPQWTPLGTQESLQTWLNTLSRRLDYRVAKLGNKEPKAPVITLKAALRQLQEQFWQPVESLLPDDTTSLCLSPDASLNFLSFAVLLDETDQFLASRYPLCAYVSNGRDLLLPTHKSTIHRNPSLIVAVDRFAKAGPPNPASTVQPLLAETISTLEPLAGAKRETELIAPLLGQGTSILRGSEAVELGLRNLTKAGSPTVLHLVTHGFFIGDDNSSPGNHRLQDFEDNPLPLYRSGLVLHGAKRSLADTTPPPPESDDILFASDVASLNLHNTELVSLSSCQSALGESLSGEGVLGLRRGFASAGARNLLLTLWPVSDATTPDYMHRFYQLATETGHLSQSAWQTQREGLATVDPGDPSQLETAVLTLGPFVLFQRQALTPPAEFSPPSPPPTLTPLLLGSAIGVLLATLFYAFTRRNSRRN